MADLQKIVDDLSSLTVLEAAELAKLLEEKWGVSAAAAVAVALVLTACQPTEVPKQAEEVASVAAEGALLAHGAAEGTTTDTFAREHAKALRTLLGQRLDRAVARGRLTPAGRDAVLACFDDASKCQGLRARVRHP